MVLVNFAVEVKKEKHAVITNPALNVRVRPEGGREIM
jgi:hypothetical protein